MQSNQFIIVVVIIVLAIGGFVGYSKYSAVLVSGKLDGFAQCIKNSGTQFYGAFWCPHCAAQKKLFGTSEKLLPYIECSTPDGKAQLQVCIDKSITGYPTWFFPDGTNINKEMTLEELADKTKCELPK